ncbi:hypothetical protein [Streptomyces sp. NPDC050738]|uniref:hypothetical protein n=1 Tax=Streptomyces sp. NPDC050738 TaxID=3154744 RepID=UPI003436E871
MCPNCEDLNRTVLMLSDLALYAAHVEADQHFADVVGHALAESLPLDAFDPPLYGIPPGDPGEES